MTYKPPSTVELVKGLHETIKLREPELYKKNNKKLKGLFQKMEGIITSINDGHNKLHNVIDSIKPINTLSDSGYKLTIQIDREIEE